MIQYFSNLSSLNKFYLELGYYQNFNIQIRGVYENLYDYLS